MFTSNKIVFSLPFNLSNENVFDHLPPTMNSINLNGTVFNTFPRQLFMNKNLKSIQISGIHINSQELQNQLFGHLPQLEYISINNCNITILFDDLFVGSSQLNDVSLAHNNLLEIPKMIFLEQKNLLRLDLSFNDLLTLDDALFDKTNHINVLRLSYNRLSNISM